jgi:hypothetical protein
MSEDVAEVRNHWWWRPGWREGRHIYACHLILDDQPQLRALVARYQEALKATVDVFRNPSRALPSVASLRHHARPARLLSGTRPAVGLAAAHTACRAG